MRFPGSLDSARWVGATIARRFSVWLESLLIFMLVACMPVALASPAEQAPSLQYQKIIRNYGPADGLSQSSVNELLQGQDGYLWIGTFGGLVRFDGNKFTTLRATHGKSARRNPSDSGGPGSDRIVALREDARGRIWIGTEDGGVSLYDHGRFLQLPVCGGTCRVHMLTMQVDQNLWAITTAGLFRIDTDSLRAVRIRDSIPGRYTNITVANGHVYLSGGTGKSLAVVAGDSIVPVPLPQGVTSTFEIVAAGNYIWVLTNQGLYRFDPLSNSWLLKIAESKWDASLLESSDGLPWMATVTGKLLRGDPSGELKSFDIPPAMFVNAIWRDHAGVLWIGSRDKGLWSIQTSKAMLQESPGDIAVHGRGGRAVIGDGAGGVWLGYGCGGVRHRLKDGSFESSRARAVRESECVVSLLQDPDGSVWVGTVDAGLQRIVGGSLEKIPQSLGLSNLEMWQADDDEYWLAAENHTFNVRRTDAGEFVLSPPVAALEGLTIRKMAMARKGGIWFVGDQGAMRLDKGRVVERWTPAQGLSSRFARSLYEDSRGVLWIGTYGSGLNRIENGRITHYDESNGLFDDTVSCILADRTGQMWLAGNRGISVLPTASQLGLKFETVPFAVSTGSVSFEFNGGTQSSCYQDEEGYLWFALVSGFTKLDPARLAEISALQPEAHIERVVTAGVKHNPGETLVLGTSMQPLEIGYTAINLTSPDQLSFRYRISGGDAQWTQAGATRDIVIHDVPWGNHVFEVQARNRGGAWSPAATLKISRPVPWYRHQWLWPLIALLALLALIWRTRDPALSVAHDERLRRMSARKLLDQKEPSDRL